MADTDRTRPTSSGRAVAVDLVGLAAQCVEAGVLAAALVAVSVAPAGTAHPRPAVEVLVGSYEDSRPPRRPGGRWRIYLRPEVLTGPAADRRWRVAHEIAHVCVGHLDRRVRTGAVTLAPGVLLGVVAVVVSVVDAIRAAARGQVWSMSPPAVVGWLAPVAGVLLAAAAVRLKRQELALERAADAYAAGVLGVAMTAAVRDEVQKKGDRRPWLAPAVALMRSHPRPAERYAVTQALAADHARRSGDSTG